MRRFFSLRWFFQIVFFMAVVAGIMHWRWSGRSSACPGLNTTELIAPGLKLTKFQHRTLTGPVQVYVARADFAQGWRMRVAPAHDSVLRRATVSAIAAKNNAPVAVNGGFFAYEGAAIGAVCIDGEWLRLPWKNRTAIGFRPDGTGRIANLQATASVQFGDGSAVTVPQLNGYPAANALSVLTPRFASSYKLRAGELALEVEKGQVVAKVESGIARLRPEGWTLVANGIARTQLESIQVGQSAEFDVATTPAAWKDYTTILGAGPRLLRDGRIEVTHVEEEFRPDVIQRGPRTGVGIDTDGNWVFVVADGFQECSVGLTLPELALVMQQLGVRDAIHMDCGPSSVLVVNNQAINRPSWGKEPTVPNAVLITQSPTKITKNH